GGHQLFGPREARCLALWSLPLQNKSSGGSLTINDCRALMNRLRDENESYLVGFEHRTWLEVVRSSSCRFGYRHAPGTYWGAYIGSDDMADLIRDTIAKCPAMEFLLTPLVFPSM